MDIKEIKNVSNPDQVLNNAYQYYNKLGIDYKNLGIDQNKLIMISSHKNKKYMIYDPYIKKYIHFGDIRYQDYTKHHNIERRQNYLSRASKIKGNWADNPFSPNNLSIAILWR